MARTPRAIIGGGIAGLAAALALHRHSIEVTVYEQAGELSEIGAGVQMTPNAMNALRLLGVEEGAMAVAFEPESQVLRSWKSGRVIYRAPIREVFRERFGAPLCSFHRADLLSVLAAPLPDYAIRLNARSVAVESAESSAAAHFADGSTIEADIVVGADGIHSLVRNSLFGELRRVSPAVCAGVLWSRSSASRRGLLNRAHLDEALRRYEGMRVPRTRRAVLGSRERAKLNHLPSRWARLKRDVEYMARRVFYPDGTAHRVAWLYDYDIAADENYA
jgi:hypothetical protein